MKILRPLLRDVAIFLLIILVGLTIYSCATHKKPQPQPPHLGLAPRAMTLAPGVTTQHLTHFSHGGHGKHVKHTIPNYPVPLLPDRNLTPGAVDPNVTEQQVCHESTSSRRHVTDSMKQDAYDAYHLNRNADYFEVDHLISIELGGSNDPSNLWPQSYSSYPYNASTKDILENKLHSMVCDTHEITLKEAQDAISTNWIAACDKYVGKDACKVASFN